MRRTLPLITTLAVEAGAVVVLYRFIREPGFAIPIAFGFAAWLLSSTLLYLGASLARIPVAIHAAGRVTLPVVRRRVDRALAATILTGALLAGASPALAAVPTSDAAVEASVAATSPANDPDAPAPPAEDEPVVEEPTTTSTLPVRTGRVGDPASTETASTTPESVSVPANAPVAPALPPVEPAPVPAVVTPAVPGTPREPVATFPAPDVATNGAATSYTVVPGDNFWEIASRHLADATGRDRAALSDNDITEYWGRVCDANRDRIQSGDLSLIYAGEVVELPAT